MTAGIPDHRCGWCRDTRTELRFPKNILDIEVTRTFLSRMTALTYWELILLSRR
jgi:hypothetical protein